jgi:DNA-binding NarL/FixJ family response regulator
MTLMLDVEPVSVRIGLIEDDPEVVRELVDTLAAVAAATEIVPAATADDAADLIDNAACDALSLDLELDGFIVGPELLRRARRQRTEMARVVYTQYPNRRDEAVRHGADGFAVKRTDDYVSIMRAQVRAAMARQIASSLLRVGEARVPELERQVPVPKDIEAALLERSRAVAFRLMMQEPERADQLVTLLKRRGWWRVFDVSAFVRLNWSEKMNHLLSCVDMSEEVLARALSIDRAVALGLRQEYRSLRDIGDRSVLQNADTLLSVMSYLLRLAVYEPELLGHYWSKARLFTGSTQPPPWDEFGLEEFIRMRGTSGVNEALVWIRSH